MSPTQRKIIDLENRLDELESAFKIVEEKLEETENNVNKVYDVVVPKETMPTKPPEFLKSKEVVETICKMCKEERFIDFLPRNSKASISIGKIAAIKAIKGLTNMSLMDSKKFVDKIWESI